MPFLLPMPEYSIRKARESDYSSICSLLNSLFPAVHMTPEKLSHRASHGAVFYLAFSPSKELLGFVDLQMSKNTFVRGLGVSQAYRGKGIGSALLKRALKHARGAGKQKVWLKTQATNENAIRVYSSHGFTQRKMVLGSSGEQLIVMAKETQT